jgi:hypothetical protein
LPIILSTSPDFERETSLHESDCLLTEALCGLPVELRLILAGPGTASAIRGRRSTSNAAR